MTLKLPLRKTLSRYHLALLAFLVIAVAGVAHFWITNRLGVQRALYPLEAMLSRWTVQCSANAPGWLESNIAHAITEQSTLSNQIAYISPEGDISHCESGWKGKIFFSPAVDEHTRFRYASLTKILTADAVLEQVRNGNISFETKLAAVIPQAFPAEDTRLELITVEHLLRHRGGFDRLKSSDSVSVHNKKPWCPYDMVQLSSVKLDFSPGEGHSYSNLGYCLLGVVLEDVTDQPYRQYLQDKYDLNKWGIRFVDGPYFSDEVSYDFRNSSFYGENYSRYFDFNALSSSAGLSGSALALARVIQSELLPPPLNVLSAADPIDCDARKFDGCFGFGLSRYQRSKSSLNVHTQRGFLYGVSSVVLIDEHGGVVVWIGNGMNLEGTTGKNMVRRLYSALEHHYIEQGLR